MNHPGIPATLQHTATPINTLTPYPGNARRGNVTLIADSLDHHGQYRPIVVNKRTMQVLAGNHTLAAARSLGWTHIAATFIDADDDQAARIVLIDNRANDTASYDDHALVELLHSLPDLAGTGYTPGDLADLDALLTDPDEPPALTDPDDTPATPATPISREGDVWTLGPHRLVVGDGTDPDVVAEACAGRTADAYITDPPYNVSYTGGTADALTIVNDSMGDEAFRAFLTDLFAAAAKHTRPGAPVYVFHADTEGVNFRTALTNAGWDLKQVLVWVKNTLVLGRQDHQWQHEPILYGWLPGAAHSWYGGRALTTILADDQPDWSALPKKDLVDLITRLHDETTVLRYPKPARNGEHPTMKPVAMLASILDRSTRLGDLALDTCAGSGSLLIAAHSSSRAAALVELDPRYADVIARRYQEHTGVLPVRDGDAIDFTEQGTS